MAVVTKTLRATGNNTSLVRASNVVTVTLTTASTPNVKVGDTVVIAGSTATTDSFNGTFTVASVTSTTVFTYAQTGTDETATAAGTTGGDYSLMSTWESTEQTDLVTATDTHELHCYADWPSGLNDQFDIAGWTVNASSFITVKAAVGHEHNGVPGAGFYLASNNSGAAFDLNVAYTVVQDVEFRCVYNGSYPAIDLGSCNAAVLERLIAQNTNASNSIAAIEIRASETFIRNCLAINLNGAAGRIDQRQNTPSEISNCTFVGDLQWAATSTVDVPIRNCVFYGDVATTSSSYSASTGYNAFSDAIDAFGTNQVVGLTTADFVDYANNDYTPAEGGALDGAGADLSATFTDDITGATRTTPWDIGAYIAAEITGPAITDVNTTESWQDGDTGLVITGTGFV